MRVFVRLSILLLSLTLLSVDLSAQRNKKKKKEKAAEPVAASTMTAGAFSGLKLRGIGPALMSGRISDAVIHPVDRSVWYITVGSGGVWKTENSGTTWKSIFDGQGSYSIGCIVIDPNDHNVVWVGTGEDVGGRHVGYGDGIYKSLDGGKTWKNMGLKDSQHIGNIIVDPRDSNVVYVAAQGPLWSSGGERGLYKTVDGGQNWEKILGDEEWTGVNEVHFDPRDPDVLYAATHQRHRTVAALVNGGPKSGIHKSHDGGKTWRKLTRGLPGGDKGKIGIAVSPVNPDVVYATIEAKGGGFYRSINAGGTWEKRNSFISGGTGPHYYQEIWASPHDVDVVYQANPRLMWTTDGGKTMTQVGEPWKHGDNHAVAFLKEDPNYLMVGSDGGLYESWDLGKNWKYHANLPLTQFYKVAVDYDEPFYNIYGGTQDNNTQGGPSRTDNINGIRNSDWFITVFADGHQPAVDYTNPDIVYSEWQQGNLVRYDRKNGEIVYIKPQGKPGDDPDRFNWDSPILISPHKPERLYFASQRLWRSEDRGDSWTPVSGDLTRNQDRLLIPHMGRQQSVDALWDLFAMSQFNTITSVSESPVKEGVLWIGTDDGLIQVSGDGGANWTKTEAKDLPGLPPNAFINDIKADNFDENTAYVVLDNHKEGDFNPYLYKTTDMGKTWTSVAGNLPERQILWRIVQDHVKPELMFVGAEFGIFFTVDGGANWVKLTGGAPTISFRDLAIQKRENDLVGASFGRGFWILDDYSPLRHVDEESMKAEAKLFPIRDAWWYMPRRPMGRPGKATQGASFFVAPNPDFGAVFTYHLGEGYSTKKATRQKEERKLIKEGKDTPHPGMDALRAERDEDRPTIILTVRDSDGKVVRHLKGPARKGFHRVAWDLRYPSTAAWTPPRPRSGGAGYAFGNPESGWWAAPGDYTVTLQKRIDGELIALGDPQPFKVKPLGDSTLKQMTHQQVADFLRDFEETERTVSAAGSILRSLNQRVGAIKSIVTRTTLEDGSVYQEAMALGLELGKIRDMMYGQSLEGGLGYETAPGVSGRMGVVSTGVRMSTYGPTKTHLEQYEFAKTELAEVRKQLDDIMTNKLPALEAKLEAAGVPWTPGRGLPGQ